MKQGQDLFVIINNENLEKGKIKEQLENYEDRHSHKKGLFLFYSEKDYKCYSFEFDEKGILKEEIDYDLKKLRLAISDKPVTPNPRELSSPQSSNLYIQQNKNSVNELFFSLLTRGEIEFFKKADIKQFPDCGIIHSQFHLQVVSPSENGRSFSLKITFYYKNLYKSYNLCYYII